MGDSDRTSPRFTDAAGILPRRWSSRPARGRGGAIAAVAVRGVVAVVTTGMVSATVASTGASTAGSTAAAAHAATATTATTAITATTATKAATAPATAPATAAAETLEPTIRTILAPRGGVALIPMRPAASADPTDASGWPTTVPVALADGRTLEGLVAVIGPAPQAIGGASGWTDAADPRRVMTPGPGVRGQPVLLIRLPADGEGPIAIADRQMDARWRTWDEDYDPFGLPEPDAEQLARTSRPDRPDPDDPFAYWRWVLMADELGLRPPPPPGDERTRRVAESIAAGWRIGLVRIGRQSPGVASAVRDALTLRVTADDGMVAAWRTDRGELDTVLAWMLDERRTDQRMVDDILSWVDALPSLLIWRGAQGSIDPDQVAVHLLNRGLRPLPVRLAWTERQDEAFERTLPPRSLTRLTVSRPWPSTFDAFATREAAGGGAPGRDAAPGEASGEDSGEASDATATDATTSAPDSASASASAPAPIAPRVGPGGPGGPVVLIVASERASQRIAFPPPWVRAAPPGVEFSPMRPALTLADVERTVQPAMPSGLDTTASLRRRVGQWEVFIECRRPLAPDAPGARPTEDVVELLVGPRDDPRAIVRIPERGRASLMDGIGPMPDVVRRSWGDRWYARIRLPIPWVEDGRLALAVRRRHVVGIGADGEPEHAIVSAPSAVVPWDDDPGRVHIDLSGWDDG